jgi:hypothetical protein
MRLFLLIVGGLWLVLAAVGTAQMLLSALRRRKAHRLGVPPLATLGAMVIAGVGSVMGGLLTPPSLPLAVVCLTPMLVLSVIQRRQLRERDDLPPPLARMLDVTVNPLMQLRHPIATARALWAAFGHPIRSRREMRDWEARQPED